ncbi:MAG: 1-deoxy-D-xylulose-5-phosphate synthase [Chlamydiales bacterium]|nr:1-deoxy-D-xylulose-5-phosphate synthase [Chlamydiales bacterium]MCH9620066.1 1-deoxy-D-xylulose-5-phosphate synthase [Chlamydiales bacterium]MCH9623515.1 1-deoxy-D-xylulose-5-phosphate synthase [Chlamydiales bacterium]
MNETVDRLRQRIIDVMAKNGGHLASNLGSVELTVALHHVFNSPEDKFIFDVSHQTYAHKLLTERDDDRFDKIRKSEGLSGFAHPEESPHDHFYAGHAGTALSLALGMAKARDLAGEENYIIPIIGDATLTCGLTLEALNNIPKKLKNFIIILNDNAMAISHNVGGITTILSRMLSNPMTNKLSHEFERILEKVPLYGSTLVKQKQKIGDSVKGLFSTSPFFEQYGLAYIGPVDGHDVNKLAKLFTAVKELEMPVIIHANTIKGFGLPPAEEDPVTFHGVKPFDPQTCEFLPSPSKQPTFPKLFGQHLVEMGKKDRSLTVVTPAMSLGACLDPFFEAFPDRSFDVGIAEGHAVTFCGGLAKQGNLHVICSIYSTFFQRALDNLFQDVCLQKIPVVFAVDRAGLAYGDGATHHGIYEMSFLKAMPNMVICQPRNGQLLKELTQSAFGWKRPTAIRYPNLPTTDATETLHYRPLGRAEVISEGEDVLIIALGHHVESACKLAELLPIKPTIVDPIFLKPLDLQLISKLFQTHKNIVTIEEHSLKGGLASEIAPLLSDHNVLNFGVPEQFLDHGNYQELLEKIGMTPKQMAQKIIETFSFKKELEPA